jgi:hypothetical protein
MVTFCIGDVSVRFPTNTRKQVRIGVMVRIAAAGGGWAHGDQVYDGTVRPASTRAATGGQAGVD